MSELKKLLQGVKVEWKALGSLCSKISSGKNKSKSHYGKYPVYGSTGIIGRTNIKNYSSKHILVARVGANAGYVHLTEGEYDVSDNALIISNNKNISTKFLFYYLVNFNLNRFAKGAGQPLITGAFIKNLLIPIPCPDHPEKSLKIQKEIVRILDSLSEETNKLTTALQNERDSHQKRYEYHLSELFKFEGKEVEWKKISEVGKFQRGKRFVRNDMISDGVPCIHYGEMYTHYGISAVESKSYVSKDLVLSKKLRVAEKGDVIIVAAGETIEDIGKGTAWLGEESVVTHDACFSYKSPVHPVYFAYFTRTNQYHDQIKRNISSGKISAINEKGFSSVVIPIPSMEEQERIVKTLDELDRTTQAITTEIKKEIALRNKHYEYYRDALLTFPKEVSKVAEPVTA